MTRFLLLGKNGQIGWELERTLSSLGDLTALDRKEADLTDLERLRQTVRDRKPDWIVNAAAYTDVDGAEAEAGLAMRVNGEAPGILAQEAQRLGARLIHYSTDYVFDGRKGLPYTESDSPNPINAYGRSKLAGEHAVLAANGNHLVMRTSWVYSTRRTCFVTKVLDWPTKQTELRIVEDQMGSPTWCQTVAEATTHAISVVLDGGLNSTGAEGGLFHIACRGASSRYDLAQRVVLEAGLDGSMAISRATSEEFPAPAQRPHFSALECTLFENTFGCELPTWQDALHTAIANRTS